MPDPFPWAVADNMRDLLVTRAQDLTGCTQGSAEEAELSAIADLLDTYDEA